MALSDAHLQILFFQSVLKCERFIAAVVTEPDCFGASSLAHFFFLIPRSSDHYSSDLFWVFFFIIIIKLPVPLKNMRGRVGQQEPLII